MKYRLLVIGTILGTAALAAHASIVDGLLQKYQTQGAQQFDAAAGKALWTKSFGISAEGKERRCTTCHTDDLRRSGEHVKTGKKIEPLAPSVNSKRLTDVADIEKWFKRNCEWTLGRECSPQEKGNFLAYIRNQ